MASSSSTPVPVSDAPSSTPAPVSDAPSSTPVLDDPSSTPAPVSNTTKKITLKSSDGEIFEVEEAVALQSLTIKSLLEDSSDDVIPLPNVTSATLAKVIEFCKKYAEYSDDDDFGLFKNQDSDSKAKWNKEFLRDLHQSSVFDLILASNYLNIQCLLDVTVKHIADMFVGKTPEQIRKTFGIVNDYTPEEEEEVRRENAWAFE